MAKIELVRRADCGLCEEAIATLRALGLDFEQRDVDADPTLLETYGERVPVLLVDGRPAAEGHITPPAALRALAGG